MTSGCRFLTEHDLEEVLMGEARPEVRSHCEVCTSCHRRIAPLASSLEAFRGASLAWSEARSNTITRDLSGHKPAWRLTGSAVRSAATVFVLGVAAIGAGTHPGLAGGSGAAIGAAALPVTHAFASEVRAREIAQDNAMLQAIDSELAEGEAGSTAFAQTTDISDRQQTPRQVRD